MFKKFINDAFKVSNIIILLTLLTGLIGVITFITGRNKLPDFFSTSSTISHAHTLLPVLQDFAPSCDTVSNPSWVIPDGVKSSTSVQCSSVQGLEMVPSSTATLAELDLDRINGQLYSQTELDAKIRVTFGNNPDSNTMAGLVVQTPQQGIGGYGLAINNLGYWELVNNKNQRVASGNVTTPQTVFNLELKVEGERIYGRINGEQVLANDTSNPSEGAIGLIIYGGKSLASVYFSNFELDL